MINKNRNTVYYTCFCLPLLLFIFITSCDKEEPNDGLKQNTYSRISPSDINLAIVDQSPEQIEVRITTSENFQTSYNLSLELKGQGKFVNNQTTRDLTMGPNDTTNVLISSTNPGTGILEASLDGLKKQLELTFTNRIVDFSLALSNHRVVADGVSQARIELRTTELNGLFNKPVTFTSTGGTFLSQTVNIGADSTAVAYLKHDQIGAVEVSASVEGNTKRVLVNFGRAWPDLIKVNPEAGILQRTSGAKLNLSAALSRSIGKVSEGTWVLWQDSVAGNSPGVFLNFSPSNGNQTAGVEYHLLDTSFTGDIYLKAIVDTGNGFVIGRNKITVP